jgi:hypothetical protein
MHLCQHSGRLLIPVSKKVFGFWSVQLRTTAVASSLSRNILPLKTPSAVQTNGELMKPRQDCTVDEAVHPASASVQSPALKRRCEDERCLGGSKVNPSVFFVFSSCTIFSTLPTLIPVSCESSRTVTRRLSRISSSILTTLAGVTEVLGLRAWGLFSARSSLLYTIWPNCSPLPVMFFPRLDLKPSKDFGRSDTFLRQKFYNYALRDTAGYFLHWHRHFNWLVWWRSTRLVLVASLSMSMLVSECIFT